jgi:acetyl-CoA carboxylase carboxyl transferase subunit alpha
LHDTYHKEPEYNLGNIGLKYMTKQHFLEFETPLADLHKRLGELNALKGTENELPVKDLAEEIERLYIKEKSITRRLYRNLTAWQKVQVARHPNRPHAKDYIKELITDFTPLAGDRLYGEDKAMLSGIGRFLGKSVVVLGIEKGKNTQERVKHNFGMPKPEGYRKAQRLMDMAEKFKLPLITFVDTPGAFPGIEAEERGQSEAIASSIEKLLSLNVPVISVITGEGGSGGALAIAVADKVLMLEYSVYSVISPEGCASILWRDARKAELAAEALKMTTKDLEKLNVIDAIIKEPVGGAQRDVELTMKRVSEAIAKALSEVEAVGASKESRRQKFIELTRLDG